MKDDIHKTGQKLEVCIARYFKGKTFSEKEKKKLKDFYTELLANGFSQGRVAKCLTVLSTLRQRLGKEFQDTTEKDIIGLFTKLELEDYSEWYKHDMKIILRKYMRFLGKDETVGWLKIRDVKNKKSPTEVLTEEEIKKLASTAYTKRDEAFVLCLYESGCRIGEFLPLKMNQITFDKYGAVLQVMGKTGERRIRIVASVLSLQHWLNEHPNKNDPRSYIWTKIPMPNNPIWKNQHLSYGFICKKLRELAKKAGINKRVNPHAFRHARATFMARHLTEAQMKENFGWDQASNMAAVYVHLSGRDVDNAILGVYGYKKAKDEQDPVIKIEKCGRCGNKNSPGMRFCGKCGLPLGESPYSEDKAEDVLIDFLKIMADSVPGVKEKFRDLVKEKGLEDMFS